MLSMAKNKSTNMHPNWLSMNSDTDKNNLNSESKRLNEKARKIKAHNQALRIQKLLGDALKERVKLQKRADFDEAIHGGMRLSLEELNKLDPAYKQDYIDEV